ncbi:TIGR00725 family protein [bacterium]
MNIGVIGGRKSTKIGLETAYKIGQEIAKAKDYLICGGYSGIMEEACRGAKSKKGTTIGILMFQDKRYMNPYVDIPIVTAMSHARNAIICRSADLLIAIEGNYGTLSEIGLGLASKKIVIGFNTWDIKGIIQTQNMPELIKTYKNMRKKLL